MCKHAMAALLTGFALAIAGFCPGPAQAQRDSAVPAVSDSAPKPIGKVVVATGSVTVERTGARVIQASVDAQAGQAKVGDVVYEGDVVATGADGRVGINFTDGTAFNLSSNARMALSEFVYDPNGTSNKTLLSLTKGTFTCRQGRDDWRYEDRYPCRDIRDSRHHAARRNFGGRDIQIFHPH